MTDPIDPMPLDKISKHVFYVAHCSACDCTADGDGLEYAESPEAAIDYVLEYADWSRAEPGKLLCEDCHPITLDDRASLNRWEPEP